PKVRSLVYQVVLCAAVAFLIYAAASNAIENLRRAHIASGFGFWYDPAGFDISQTLIQYSSQASTYGRAFWVGLLNTLLVAGLGIVFATILGFTIGIARLSKNWLLSKFATGYVEIIRNIPLLLQLLFWYNAVLFLPSPVFLHDFDAVVVALIAGAIAALAYYLWARKRQERTGRRAPVFWVTLVLLVGLPLAVFALRGFPLTFDYPQAGRFNINGGVEALPEFA